MHTVKIESYIKQTFLSYGFSHQKKSNLTNDIVVMFKTMVISGPLFLQTQKPMLAKM